VSKGYRRAWAAKSVKRSRDKFAGIGALRAAVIEHNANPWAMRRNTCDHSPIWWSLRLRELEEWIAG